MPQATSLAAEIQASLSLDAQLIPSRGGKFEVSVDGQLVYSKLETGHFPEHAELLTELKRISAA